MDLDDPDKDFRPREVPDYGIEVNFDSLEDEDRNVSKFVSIATSVTLRKDGSPEIGKLLDDAIAKLNAEVERMSPNMKAVERFVFAL